MVSFSAKAQQQRSSGADVTFLPSISTTLVRDSLQHEEINTACPESARGYFDPNRPSQDAEFKIRKRCHVYLHGDGCVIQLRTVDGYAGNSNLMDGWRERE